MTESAEARETFPDLISDGPFVKKVGHTLNDTQAEENEEQLR